MSTDIRLIDLTLSVWEPGTEKAIQVSDGTNLKNRVWLPRSQIEICDTMQPGIKIITLPEWLALEKGLI